MNYLVFVPLLIASLLPWQPQPGDSLLVEGTAWVVERDDYHVAGYLPTPCHQARMDGDRVYSVADPGLFCLQTLTPFEIVFWR